MEQIQLIFFQDCPNYSIVKNLLTDLGLSFEEIEQSSLSEIDPLRLFTSPSILKNGELIFGQKINTAMGGCSLNLPKKSDLIYKLKD